MACVRRHRRIRQTKFSWMGSADHAHDVGLLHDQEVIAIDLDFGSRPLAEQHTIARLQVDRDELAGLVAAAWANGHDLALLRLLLGGVRNDDAALGLLLGVDALHDHAIMQGTKLGLCHFFPRTWSPAKALKNKAW